MKKVCLFNCAKRFQFDDYDIHTFDPFKYFEKGYFNFTLSNLIKNGLQGVEYKRMLLTVEGVDTLYRARDPYYMEMANDFVEMFSDFDIIIMSTFNFIHPEILTSPKMSKPIKVLGFVDDPYSTYTRGMPYLWAFDGACHISPSYLENKSFKDALSGWGCDNSHFWPLVSGDIKKIEGTKEFFENRAMDLCYVGNPNSAKVDKLIVLKKHFGKRLNIYGRWPYKGYAGYVRFFFGEKIFPYKISSLSAEEKIDLYSNVKIGLNMHVSDKPRETGNMRMYELPAYGVLQVCDKAGLSLNETIFNNREAVYYDNFSDAIEKIEYFLKNDKERIEIAKNGYNRFWSEYDHKLVLRNLLDWSMSLRINN